MPNNALLNRFFLGVGFFNCSCTTSKSSFTLSISSGSTSEIDNNDNLKKWYTQANSDIDKLQIMRVYLDKNPNIKIENAAFMGFITETYHIENNELKTLDEKEFDTIPYYIIKICDEIMNNY